MKTQKLIAIDLDGTLLNSDLELSKKTAETIKRLQADGIITVIATGRIFSSAQTVLKSAGLEMPIIACNGGVAYDPSSQQYYKDKFSLELAENVVSKLQELDIYHHFYTNDTIFVSELAYTAKKFYDIDAKNVAEGKPTHVKAIEVMPNLRPALADNDVYKFGIIEEDCKDFASVRAHFDAIPQLSTVFSNVGLCDIGPAGVSKWSALEKLLELYNLTADDVLAFGDSPNDKEMLSNAAWGVAMGNASEKLKKLADDVTTSNNQEGVANYLLKYYYNE